MRSFAVAVEPAPAPRVAALAVLLHVTAATFPWLTRVPAALAAALCLAAAGSLALTLACLPGAHCRVEALRLDGRGCRLRRAGTRRWLPATLGPGSRAYAGAVLLDLRAGRRRFRWLLPRTSVPAADFRRLKARVRLTC